MTGERYVRTKKIQDAVGGREEEVLTGLGIQAPRGNQHIDCPYPEHGGCNDWRFDFKKRKAFCTCIPAGKSDSIFNVVMKCEGLDFEAAKVRIAELAGLNDLIEVKKGDGKRGQRTTASALLNPPAENRDDRLVAAYLAHRLQVPEAEVLLPFTAVVGIKALGYFDPPKGKGKPVLVGEPPCAVFRTEAADGRFHAHRIYLAPGGAGKADLGETDEGRPRDPKKSARTESEDNVSGRSVLWGRPALAHHIVLTEGIETGAAVALALRPEIEAGTMAVAAAISAGGVEAFQVYPTTVRVTVAADRDEASKAGRAPSRRGEQAARRFGIRQVEAVSVTIALPGGPGTATDWLDVVVVDGVETVRAGILGGSVYRATAEELAEEQVRVDGLSELQQVERDYPLPKIDAFALTYQRTASGRIRVHRFVKSGEDFEAQPIASPFGVLARLRYIDEDDEYGLRLAVQDMGGRQRLIDVDRAAFAKQGAAETRAMLFGAGLRAENDGEHIAVKCLKAADPTGEIVLIRTPGWHELEGLPQKFFACPDGGVMGDPGKVPLELSVASRISERVAHGGTLDGWKAAVAAAVAVEHCEHWILGACAGFAGTLISLTGMDSCGISFSGITSGGKTTAQRLAVSAWTRAALDQRESLLQTARATANGIETIAARSNGTVLAMDELGHLNGKELGRVIYTLAGGTGKVRMTADARLRASHVWSTFVVLSSEKSLEEKVRGDGGEWFGGMAVRIPDVDITGVDRSVDRTVMARIRAVDQHFGHAGPAFVEALMAAGYHRQPDELRAGVQRQAEVLAGAGADGAMVRAAVPFAVLSLAGRLARGFGLLPADLDVDRAIRWAWGKFTSSSDAVALDPVALTLSKLEDWIAERWGSSIHPTERDDDVRPPPRDAMGWYDDDAIYIPAHRIVEAAGGTLKAEEIGKALKGRELIARTKGERHLYVDYVPKVGKVKAYALVRNAFRTTGKGSGSGFTVFPGGRS